MLKRNVSCLLAVLLLMSVIGVFAAEITGDAVTVSAEDTTLMYALNNLNVAEESNLSYADIQQGVYNENSDPADVVIGAEADGNSWFYTLNVVADGTYYIDVLGWSGWSITAGTTDAGGRFTLTIDDTVLTDGSGDDPLILPPWSGSNGIPNRYQFTDDDKVRVGRIDLTAGTHTMTFTMNKCAAGNAGIHKIYITPKPTDFNGVEISTEGDTVIPATAYSEMNAVEQSTWGEGIVTMKAPSSWAGDGWYMTYDIYVSEPGTYHVGVRNVLSRGNGYNSVGEQLYDAPSITVSVSDGTKETKLKGFKSASSGGSTFANTGLLPLNHAGYVDLQEGIYTIKLSGASYNSHFQSVVIGPTGDDQMVKATGTTSFSALEPVAGLYTIGKYAVGSSEELFVALKPSLIDENGESYTNWDAKWADWRVGVPDGADGWYDVWFNATTYNNAADLPYNVRVDGKTMDVFFGRNYNNKLDPMPETDKVTVYLSAGIHTVGIYDRWGGQGAMHFQSVNLAPRAETPVHTLGAETRIPATGWAEKNHLESIYTSYHSAAKKAIAMLCEGDNNVRQYLDYEVEVPEGSAGWYKLALGISAWDIGSSKAPVWGVIVNGGTDIGTATGLGSEETEASYTFDSGLTLATDPNALLPACEVSDVMYLSEGQHTIRVHTTKGNGYRSFIQYLLFTKTDTDKIAAEISAANQTEGTQIIEAENFSSIYGGARRAAPWGYYNEPGVTVPKNGKSGKAGGVGYKIDVKEPGTYNIGVAAAGPSNPDNAYFGVFVDGNMRGIVIPQTGSGQFTPSHQWVRSVELTEGIHEIHMANYFSYALYIDEIMLQKVEYGYNDVPQGITYTRDADAEVGYADGTITVTPVENTTDVVGYHLYWGNAEGRLADYSAFGYIPAKEDGTVPEYKIERNLRIPQEATKILVYAAKNVHSTGVNRDGSTATSMIESASYISTDLPANCTFTLDPNEKLFSFWVMSDTHVQENFSYWSVEAHRALRQVMEVDDEAIGIFNCGDVTAYGEEEEYASLKEGYDEIIGDAMPMYLATGNHDHAWNAHAFQKNFLEYASYLSGGRSDVNKPYYYFKENGCYFIFLADETAQAWYGPSDEQLDWLEALLDRAEAEKSPVFMFTHYILDYTAAGGIGVPNGPNSLDTTQHITDAAKERYTNMVKDRENLIIFNGHDHEAFAHWYSVYSEPNSTTHLPLPSVSIRFGGGGWGAQSVLEDGTLYNNHFTRKSGMYYVEVYNGYVAAKGWDIDTKTWDGSAQALIKTSFSPVNVTCENDTLTLRRNPNYTGSFDSFVGVYDGNKLENVVQVSGSELSTGAVKTVTLPALADRRVKIFLWNGLEAMQPVCAAKEIE